MIFRFFLLLGGIIGQNPPAQPDRWDAIVGDYEYFLAKSTFAEEDKKTDLIQFYFRVNFSSNRANYLVIILRKKSAYGFLFQNLGTETGIQQVMSIRSHGIYSTAMWDFTNSKAHFLYDKADFKK